MKRSAFTLIELLVVVLIIGILAAVAVPQYQKAILKTRYASMMNGVNTLAQAEEMYYLANGKYTSTVSQLDISMLPNTCTPNEEPATTAGCPDGVYFIVRIWSSGNYIMGKLVMGNVSPLYYMVWLKNQASSYADKSGKRVCMVNATLPGTTRSYYGKICTSFGGKPDGGRSWYF